MFRLKEKPPVAAMDFVQCVPDTFKAAFDNKPDGLVMRAAVFCTIDDVTYLLLLKRAETDSLPGRWELPGGESVAGRATNISLIKSRRR